MVFMVPLSDKPVDEAVLFYLADDAVVNDVVADELARRVGRPGWLKLDSHALADQGWIPNYR